ncbi:MAG: winged helix-turn-helix transcriptional regulator [Nitrospirae bacterium]|nr:MAG: winged helix-turn-helix transcriptional regulator [Nitrospirota bacterium]
MFMLSDKTRAKTAEMCHAFQDGMRLDILDWLKEGERGACELTDASQAGQSCLSFHRKVLKDADLIHYRPEGRWVYYSINSDGGEKLKDPVASLRTMGKTVRPSPRC